MTSTAKEIREDPEAHMAFAESFANGFQKSIDGLPSLRWAIAAFLEDVDEEYPVKAESKWKTKKFRS